MSILHGFHCFMWRVKNCFQIQRFHKNLERGGVTINEPAAITFDSTFEGKNAIGKGSELKWVRVGYGTYFGTNCYFERTKIGRFCSIARDVNIIAGTHPTHTFVSTHPAFFSLMQEENFGYVHKKKFQELKYAEPERKLAVVIGNDVWVGANASIMEGVHIGDGAIVAANALVTKDVEPFEIVAGVPAKHMKWRFDENQRRWLNEYQWWNKSLDWIKNHAEEFEDIEKLRKSIED